MDEKHLPDAETQPAKGRRLNNADITLLFAAALFLLALGLRLQYPAALWARIFLFCAEAALVGGVADWFAVTALFEKPLGFPWHTAILPRRRPEFMEAATRLIQQNFFSRKRLFSLMENYDWRGTLTEWLRGAQVRTGLQTAILRQLRRYAQDVDCRQAAEKIASVLQRESLQYHLQDLLARLTGWLRKGDNDRRLLAQAASFLRQRAETPEAQAAIAAVLEEAQEKKLENMGVMARFFASMAQAAGIVDVEEMSSLIQQEVLRVLDEAAEPGSNLQEQIRTLFYRQLETAGQDAAALETFDAIRDKLLREVPLTPTLETVLRRLQDTLTADSLPPALDRLLEDELNRILALFDTSESLRQQLELLAYDIMARSALQAQSMIGSIAREVMNRMTDDQLNHIVRDKIEPDLIWIRMNGSIVGAIIGLGLFVVLELFRYFI
ncbi:MAG: DUF445 domain-containing protein [Schwartzia sp.]|nr:DUF445 domain-containing protein [Schwartzia sp. (in: firmicutes)]